MKRKLITAALLMALVLTPVMAMDISVEDAVSMAMEGNPQLISAELDLKLAKTKSDLAWNTLLPTVNGTLSLSRSNEVSSLSKILATMMGQPAPTEPSISMVAGISVQEAFNPAMITSILMAKENLRSGEITFEKAQAEVKVNVQKLYYGLVLQQKAYDIQVEMLESKKARMDQAQADFDNGFVPELYLLQTQVSYENAVPEVESARLSLESTKRTMAILLGLDLDTEINLTTPIEQSFVNVDESAMLDSINNRFDIRSLDGQMKTLKLSERAMLEKTYCPNIILSGSYQPVNSDIKKDFWSKDSWADNGSMSVTVSWSLTGLLPFSSDAVSLKELRSNIQKVESSRDVLAKQAVSEIIGLLDTIEKSVQAIESSERTIVLAQKSCDAVREAYASGSKDLLDLTDAENQLKQARLGQLQSIQSYMSAIIDLEYATQQTVR